jgi:hypothetical protein
MRGLTGAFILGCALIAAPQAVKANLLKNPKFELVTPVGNPPDLSPNDWTVSWLNPAGGVAVLACPGFFGSLCSDKGSYVALLSDSIPQGVLPKPVALSQAVTLNPGAYRFGGEFALFIWEDSLGPTSVINESEVFLSIFSGVAPFPITPLGRIDLSPQRFTPADFSITIGSGPFFKATQFKSFEDVFTVPGSTPVTVTLQLVVLPKVPPGTASDDRLRLSSVFVFADNMFLDRTRIAPVPAPGALGVFAIALAGLAAVRRRKAAEQSVGLGAAAHT